MYRKIQKYYTLIPVLAFIILAPISLNISKSEPVLIAYAQQQQPPQAWSPSWTDLQYLGNPAALVRDIVGSGLSEFAPGVADKVTSSIGNTIGSMILGVGSFTTWLGGKIFDASVDKFVVQFGSLVRESEFESALTRSWSTVRDICNLAFIFGFIYIGIMTIISPDSASMKRFLAKIIIGALLINFSLYITQVVIDFTNFTAVKVYDAIVPPNSTQNGEQLTISRAIGNYLGINGLFSNVEPEALDKMNTSGSFAYYLAATVFLVVTGFTLAAGGLHLLVRFVELLLIMIFSPIFFAALVFPQTERYADKVKHKLLSASFYAPVYMLLLYLSLSIANALVKPVAQGVTMISVITGTTQGANINTATGPIGAFTIVINFIIIIFLMISALTLAKKMSVYGGQMAINLGNSAQKGARGYLGRGAVRMADAGIKKIPGMAGGMQGAEKYRQQLRGSDKWYARAGGKVFGVTAGAVATRALGAKFGSTRSVADVDRDVDKEEKGYKKANFAEKEKTERENSVAAGVKATPGSLEAAKMQQSVVTASTAQLIELLGKFEKDTKAYTSIVAAMGHSQFEKLMDEKEENLAEADKAKIRTARQTTVEARLVEAENKRREEEARKAGRPFTDADKATEIADNPRMVAKAAIGDLEVLGVETIQEYAQYLTAAQLEDIKKSKKFVEAQYNAINDARKLALESIVTDAAIIDEIQGRPKAEDVAKLPGKFLENAARVPKALSVDVLEKIISQSTVDRGSQQRIVDLVRKQAGLSPEITTFMDSAYVINRFGPKV